MAYEQLDESDESSLAKTMIRERLSRIVLMKHKDVTARRQQLNFPSDLWYGVGCDLKEQGWKQS